MADTKHLKEIYDEEWVMKRRNLNHGLLGIQTILHACNDPEDHLKVIHVAGTNGKGSTCNLLKDILVSQGYKVGMFTSPHLITHRDRIRIDDTYISHEQFTRYLLKHIKEIEAFDLGMFEIDTLIAFEWFVDEKVDYAIMECGLGGRLDSTNVVKKPYLEIITSISFDHMELLGNRISQIAFEKAGIIMPQTRCLIGELDPHAEKVIRMHAYRRHAQIIHMHAYERIDGDHFRMGNDIYQISTHAEYQMHNTALALSAAQLLGIDIKKREVYEAVKNSEWRGRFETVHEDPPVIIDGAHNVEGIKALCNTFYDLDKPVVCIFTALKDKQVYEMGLALKRYCDHLIVTQFDHARADHVEDMKWDDVEVQADWQSAIDKGMDLVEKKGTLVITGSLYFISLVRERFQK